MKPSLGISEKQNTKTVRLLSILLADQMTLYVKTRKFHWNVTGESFMELHKLFQTQYSELEISIDLIAERINQLGNATIGTMKEFSAQTRLKELPGKYPSSKEMIKELLMDHESIIKFLRKDIDESDSKSCDAGTVDILTGLMQEHESNAWILRRYLS